MSTADLTWSGVRQCVAMLCEARGWHHGVPIMSSTDPSRRVILAKGCPMSKERGHDVPLSFERSVHVCSADDVSDTNTGPRVVNMWKRGPANVCIYRENGKLGAFKLDTNSERLNLLLNTVLCQAGTTDWQTEFVAMAALRKRINDNQWECYVLTGCFPETSPRSGVTYILRKGLPTIAMRCVKRPEGGEVRNFLAALCSHPLGWYEGTHAGAYPPSDEVVANLLSIRADEHDFWKRSNQHTLNDPQAAI